MEKLRSKVKLFSNDKFVSYEEQVVDFENIVNMEHKYFKGLAKSYCPDFLIDDIGTYKIGNYYIGNTIQYSYDLNDFAIGEKSIHESGQEIKSFATEIGAILQEMITLLTGKIYQIKSNTLNSKQYKNIDFNFKRTFKKIDKLIIFSLCCRINFLLFSFKEKCRENSMLYLRIIYITFYSSKNDLKSLKICYKTIYDNCYEKEFRNCMAHYGLYNKIDIKDILQELIKESAVI